MRLYLMQHGEAVDKNVNPDRPLSGRGRRDVECVSKFVASSGVQVPKIWHSEKARARETAEILATYVNGNASERDGLGPDDDVAIARRSVERANGDIAIVGHLPHLSLLAAELLHTEGKRGPVLFRRGGIVALERNDEGAWHIRWMVVPELLGE